MGTGPRAALLVAAGLLVGGVLGSAATAALTRDDGTGAAASGHPTATASPGTAPAATTPPTTSPTGSPTATVAADRARSVILLIGDGMGDSEITLARDYQVGAAGRLAMDRLPMTGTYTTYSVNRSAPHRPDYVTDSAASGSGWATGHKTYDGAISVTPDGKAQPTLLELAKKAGYRTGDVTTAELVDATPAVLVAHVVDRSCKGPSVMRECPRQAAERGGPGSIAEQLVAARPDVALGGGRTYFDQTIRAGAGKGRSVLTRARTGGYQVVTDAKGLRAAGAATSTAPLLGLFAASNLDLEWVGPRPTRSGTSSQRCRTNRVRSVSQPHLVDMARAALSRLDRLTQGSDLGFFLQVEGASIDKQDHAADPCGQIGETVGFDLAVKAALDYQRTHPDTLVVVTADHGHTSQIVDARSRTAGVTATLRTHDGADLTVSYGTAPQGSAQQHTGTQVRIAASGPHAGSVVGVTDQTQLFTTIHDALRLL